MAKTTKLFTPDALVVQGNLNIPLVITKVIEDDVELYHGFVPGFTKEDCVSPDLDSCKRRLKEAAEKLIDQYLQEGKEFPFFPTKDEIIEDFEGVCNIRFIKI